MVNFGLHFEQHCNKIWSDYYINYDLLKAWVNAIIAEKSDAEPYQQHIFLVSHRFGGIPFHRIHTRY